MRLALACKWGKGEPRGQAICLVWVKQQGVVGTQAHISPAA